MSIRFIARWFPRPERKQEFLGVVAKLGAAFPPEVAAGIALLDPSFNRAGEFVVIEVWKGEALLNQLRESALFHDAIRAMTACCSRAPEVEILNPIGGDGSVFERYPAGRAAARCYPDTGATTVTCR